MSEYVTKDDLAKFAADVTAAFEAVNYNLQMLLWAQNGGRGQRPTRPGSDPETRSFGGKVVHVTREASA
jgi:hypothetical protein